MQLMWNRGGNFKCMFTFDFSGVNSKLLSKISLFQSKKSKNYFIDLKAFRCKKFAILYSCAVLMRVKVR